MFCMILTCAPLYAELHGIMIECLQCFVTVCELPNMQFWQSDVLVHSWFLDTENWTRYNRQEGGSRTDGVITRAGNAAYDALSEL